MDTLFLGGREFFHGKIGIGGQNPNNWFQRIVKFYAFLKKSTEFISMIVALARKILMFLSR